MILLLDIGNTHTQLGLATAERLRRRSKFRTPNWFSRQGADFVRGFLGNTRLEGAALCSVVPQATPRALRVVRHLAKIQCLELSPRTLRGVGINYPKPRSIGPDRLANVVAARHSFGAPAVVVDFGTAVTFDVLDRHGDYIGGVIAPGLEVMTDYLYEKTAMLPRIRIQEVRRVVGRSTREAMLIGAVHGFRGLVRELIIALRQELGAPRLPVVATGGYAKLMAAGLPEIKAVVSDLTLDGLRLVWCAHAR